MRMAHQWTGSAVVTVCILASLHTALCGSRSYQRPITDDELKSPITWAIDKSFSRFADEYQSDKSGRGSSYHYIYSKYLSPVRRQQMRLLEIGMGCSMHEGVNGLNTLALWRRYLTNTKISFVENDAKCVQKHKTEIEKVAQGKVYVGDQADVAMLNEIVEDAKLFSGYDIIVDDAGHKSDLMLSSLKVLWQSLKSGGIYVVEDVSETYIEKPFLDKGSFTEFVKNAIDIVQCRMKPSYMGPDSPVRPEFINFCASTPMDIISVECMPEACVLVKGKPRTRGIPEATPSPALPGGVPSAGAALGSGEAAGVGAEEAAAEMFKAKLGAQPGAVKGAAKAATVAASKGAAAAKEAATGAAAAASKGATAVKEAAAGTAAATLKGAVAAKEATAGAAAAASKGATAAKEATAGAAAAASKAAAASLAPIQAKAASALKGGGVAQPAADEPADKSAEEDTVVLRPPPGKAAGKGAKGKLLVPDDLDDEEALAAQAGALSQQAPKKAPGATAGAKPGAAEPAAAASAAEKAAAAAAGAAAKPGALGAKPGAGKAAGAGPPEEDAAPGRVVGKAAAMARAEDYEEEEEGAGAAEAAVAEGGEEGAGEDEAELEELEEVFEEEDASVGQDTQEGIEEPAAEEEAFSDAFAEEDEEEELEESTKRHRRLMAST